MIVGGLVTGPIFDAGHLRGLVLVGSLAFVVGMMMTSICKEYSQVVLAQGLVVGLGSGCMLLPSVAVMPQYFITRRAFATGIGAAGSSVGESTLFSSALSANMLFQVVSYIPLSFINCNLDSVLDGL